MIRSQIPPPHVFGLSDNSSLLELITQFFNSPQPDVNSVTNGEVVDDQGLDWGDMKVSIGQAFYLNETTNVAQAGLVTKEWLPNGNSSSLWEGIAYSTVSGDLQQLPQASNFKPGSGIVPRLALLNSKPRPAGKPGRANEPMRVAKVDLPRRYLKYDYDLLSSCTNLTLAAGNTYLVASTVNVSGTTTIEGGSVIKFTNTSAGNLFVSNVVCLTSPYNMAYFTSMNDNTLGVTVSNSTGAPSVGFGQYLNFDLLGPNTLVLSNLRFAYAGYGIYGTMTVYGTNSITISDCQFLNCNYGAFLQADYNIPGIGFPVRVYNSLFSKCTSYGIYCYDDPNSGMSFTAANVTADQVPTFVTGANYAANAKNCLFTGSGITNLTFTACVTNSTNTGIFQKVGAGNYYLPTNSPYLSVGQTNQVNGALLADLRSRTVLAPSWLTNLVTSSTVISTNVARDNHYPTNLAVGYHYAPIDWLANFTVSNCVVTLTNGVALGFTNGGIRLENGSALISQGTPTNPNVIAYYALVQEQPTNVWNSSCLVAQSQPIVPMGSGTNSTPIISLVFTEICGGPGANYLFNTADTGQVAGWIGMRDCSVYGAGAVWEMNESNNAPAVGLCDNLFHRTPFKFGLDERNDQHPLQNQSLSEPPH